MGADRAEHFLDAYAQASEVLQRDRHCLTWEVSQGKEDPTQFAVRIQWDSIKGHVEGFRKDPAFAEFFAPVRPFLADIEEMHHYHVRAKSPALPEKALPTLYDWCGGGEAVAQLINPFYDRVEGDDLLGPLFPGGVSEDHRDHVAPGGRRCSVSRPPTHRSVAIRGWSPTTSTCSSAPGSGSGSPR